MPPSFRPFATRAVLPLLLLCGGCAGGGTAAPQDPVPAPDRAPAVRPASLQEIAGALGCTPETTVDAEEVREGACGSGPGAYRMATFASDQGRDAWLAAARDYGGTYLVGARWVVTAATPEALTPLRTRLGGTIESAPQHGTSPQHGASPHADHTAGGTHP
ncbi:hypothetical protein [Streptomyces sp. NPDC089799]|uniref:hypothetical protein n=1 Tax=Streptomyces sp. NPDC089799 TaxID=3155066 RepID=UPI00341C1759